MATWLGAVMKNFDVPHNASGVIRVPCKLCQTYISGTSTSAGNFMKHLKRKHGDIYFALISVKYKYDSGVKSTKNITNKTHQEDSESNEGSPKKFMNYSQEFKLKILEYYFKNGGENKFGLKSKTAQLFRVDKKTINRMLCNPEMVRKACKAINQKPPSVFGSLKHSSENRSASQATDPVTGAQNSAVIDLPEDPDFSVLKQAISSSASGIGSVTRILVTATKEVQKIILEECDLIYECKTCKNLFRSLINYIAHKRMYCLERFVNVQNIFHKDDCEGRTTESNTVIVEPEPPDDVDENDGPKIDRIAAKLASKSIMKGDKGIGQLSSSVHKGSSKYYSMIERTQEKRNEFKKDCSVILRNVSNVNKVVYQDYVAHGDQRPEEGTKELARLAMENRMGVTAILNEDGKIVGTQVGTPDEIDMNCVTEVKIDSYFDPSPVDSPCDSPSMEDNETDESECYERTIYTCPICSTQFLSMGGCNKHLLRVHSKKKHQRDRLRQVIASRTYKKTFTKEALKNYHLKNADKTEKASGDARDKKSSEGKIGIVAEVPQTREERASKLQNLCIRCKKTFLTAGALGSHIKYCQFQPMNPKPAHEQPEKKIAIQIRKDYNKKEYVVSNITNIVPADEQRIEPAPELTAEQKRIFREVEAKTKLLSNPGKQNCIPCKKKFPKKCSLQYHIAKHLDYNRFKCSNCEFRSYHRYRIARHCEASHLNSDCFHEEMQLGTFTYDLEENVKLASDNYTMRSKDVPDDDYKKLLNSIDDTRNDVDNVTNLSKRCQVEMTREIKLYESDDEVLITSDFDPLAIDGPVKEPEAIGDTVETGFNAEENADFSPKAERPQRQRRSVEKKDFIYDTKLPKEDEGVRQDNNKRKCSPVEEFTRRKILKVEDNLCNGKSSPKPRSQSTDATIEELNQANNALEKSPNSPLSPTPSVD